MRRPGRAVTGAALGKEPLQTFIGGMRVPLWGRNVLGGWNVTFPFVRLTLFSEGLRVSASVPFLSPLVPKWEARYEELVEIAAVGKIDGFTSGILFRTEERGGWILFWASQRDVILRLLSSYGLVVESTPRPLNYFRPYQRSS
jgi:hypothetical protein